MKDFQKVLQTKKIPCENLDIFFRKFAKWALEPAALWDTDAEALQPMADREALCQLAGVTLRRWSPATLVTNVNALAKLYRQGGPGDGIVPSAEKQFPEFCLFVNGCVGRFRGKEANKP